MIIDKKTEKEMLCLKVSGRLDSSTASELEDTIKNALKDTKIIDFDFIDLEYLSSAGLRVLLGTHKLMDKKAGKMVIRNAGKEIIEVFEITGFRDIFKII